MTCPASCPELTFADGCRRKQLHVPHARGTISQAFHVVADSRLFIQDVVENIQSGVAQHMAENSLALLRFLSSDASPIPRLEHGFARPRTVFFSNLGLFVVYSFTMAKIMYVALFGASLYLVWSTGVKRVWTALGAIIFAIVGALLGANGLAFVMTNVLHKGMSWFRAEYFPVFLYGPAAIVGTWPSHLSSTFSDLVSNRCADQSAAIQQAWYQPNA